MTSNSKPTETRKTWQKPEVRTVSPAKATRGGLDPHNREGIWYTIS